MTIRELIPVLDARVLCGDDKLDQEVKTACGSDLHAKKASSGAEYDCAYADDNMYAGYPHLHFYADTEMAVRFAKKCCEYSKNKRGLV